MSDLQAIEVSHNAVLVDERVTAVRTSKRLPNNQAVDIYRVGDAVLVLGKRAEILHTTILSPQKRDGIEGSILISRRIPKSHNLSFVIDGGRRIPCVSAEISQIDWSGWQS